MEVWAEVESGYVRVRQGHMLEAYCKMEWGDLWPDAGVVEVIKYLRGARKITIPDEWKRVILVGLCGVPAQ